MEPKKTSNLIREASHAGSWYTDSKEALDKELDKYLSSAKKEIKNVQSLKALIAPHAGYSYSGSTAGWAYQYLNSKKNLRVFLLGPSHHAYMAGSGVSSLQIYQTPLGNIHLDLDLIAELVKKPGFSKINKKVDEAEHSLEMHLPFIKKVLQSEDFTLVPIIVGNINSGEEDAFGKILAKYFDEENTVFVISSDFCHWGKDFDFMYHNKEDGEIYESIEKLDRRGMNLIEGHNLKDFNKYLEETDNTICGRDPIRILLSIIANSKNSAALKTKFVKYAQSSKVTSKKESSVSYASAITFME